jgi:hypothetical protein
MVTKNKNGIYVASKIPEDLKLTIEEAVTMGSYLNKSEFVRIAIKEKLSKEGFLIKLGVKKVDYLKIKEIENQLCGMKGCIEIPTKRIIFHELGFSANFCEKCVSKFQEESNVASKGA